MYNSGEKSLDDNVSLKLKQIHERRPKKLERIKIKRCFFLVRFLVGLLLCSEEKKERNDRYTKHKFI